MSCCAPGAHNANSAFAATLATSRFISNFGSGLAHVEQYRRHGIFRFLRRYLSDYLAGRRRGLPHGEAYASIAFEREAEERSVAARLSFRPEGFPGGLPRGG